MLVAERLQSMWTQAIAAGPTGQPILDGLAFEFNDTTEGNYEDNSAETFAPVSSEVPVSTPQTGPISVNVAVSPNFQIEAKEGQSEEDIVAVIRRHLGEIADELGGNIADKLSEVFANMPVTSTKGA